MAGPDSRASLISILTDGPRPSLAVDFKEFSGNATLSAVLKAARPDLPLHRVDAVAVVARTGSGIVAAADRCVDQLMETGSDPGVVFGYCSAAGLALYIASGLERRGLRRPPVILVEPTWPTPELVRQEAEALGDMEPGGYRGPLDAGSIVAALRGPVERKLKTEGLDAEEIGLCLDLMAESHRAWFEFLAAAETADVPSHVLPTAVLLADDGLRFLHSRWPEASIRVEHLPGDSGTLLGRPETVAVIERLRDTVLSG
jgi:hypothetical protein